jgi:hypothetical protein
MQEMAGIIEAHLMTESWKLLPCHRPLKDETKEYIEKENRMTGTAIKITLTRGRTNDRRAASQMNDTNTATTVSTASM